MKIKDLLICFIRNKFIDKECPHKEGENCEYKKDKRCSIFNSYSDLPPDKKTEVTIEFFKIKWGKWTIRTVIFGLSIIFIVSIVKAIFDPTISDEELRLASMGKFYFGNNSLFI